MSVLGLDLRRLFPWPKRTQVSGGAFVDFPYMPRTAPLTPEAFTAMPSSALRLPPVYRAVNTISNDLARMPVCSYVYGADYWERMDREDYFDVYSVLNEQANDFQTAYDWKIWMVQQCLIWGNSFSVISRRGDQVYQLIPMGTADVQLLRDDEGRWYYSTAEYGDVPPEDMIHFRLAGSQRLGWGDSPVATCASSLVLARLIEQSGIEQYRSPGIGKVAITTEEAVGADAVRQMQDAFKNAHSGSEGMLRPIIVQNGASVEQIGQSLVDNDWIQARKSAVEDVARIFGIPPFVLFAETGNTFTLEQSRAYTDSLQQYAARFSAELSMKLFPGNPDFRVTFDATQLMRGTFSESVSAYQTAIQTGIMVPNEARAELGLPPIEGGDDLYVGPNMQSGGTSDDEAEDGDPETDGRPDGSDDLDV